MEKIALKREKTSNSLFESGKIVSKSIAWLLIMSSALVLVTWVVKPTEPIPVPIAGLKLDRYYAIGVFLVVYTLALLRFVIAVNYQKYLFWELSKLLGLKDVHEKPWQYIFPGTMNYLLFHGYLHGGTIQSFNLSLMVINILAVVVIPIPVVLLLVIERTTDYLSLSMVFMSLLFYWTAVKNIKAHIALDIEHRNVEQ